MTEWGKRKQYLVFRHNFEHFDHAWEFMHFLAKLARSTKAHPRIGTYGQEVLIEIDEKDPQVKVYCEGVNSYFIKEPKPPQQKTFTPTGAAFIYADGASRGNPGPSASGFAIYDQDKREVAKGGTFLGVTTNNQAEYNSLKDGAVKAKELGFRDVVIFMDSLLVVNQIKGIYKVRNRDLAPLYENVLQILSSFDSYQISHIPRELNKVADAMANEVLDESINPATDPVE